MKRVLISLATLLILGMSALAGATGSQELKSLSSKLWKTPRSVSSWKSQKNELATIYGGEDISRKLSSESYIA